MVNAVLPNDPIADLFNLALNPPISSFPAFKYSPTIAPKRCPAARSRHCRVRSVPKPSGYHLVRNDAQRVDAKLISLDNLFGDALALFSIESASISTAAIRSCADWGKSENSMTAPFAIP